MVETKSEQRVEIPRNREYRIEAGEHHRYRTRVVRGLAEVKGAEMVNDKWYVFTNTKTSLFSFTGCEIEVDGECELAYIGERAAYPKIYDIFSKIRPGENVLVLGDGRSTLALTLCNYFVRDHKTVLFTETDTSRGNVFPGTISTSRINTISFGNFKLNTPFCLYYGSREIENTELYELQLRVLAEKNKELLQDKTVSGSVLLGPFTDFGMLDKMVELFGVTRIVVSKNERLYSRIRQRGLEVEVDFVQNSGYVEENKVSRSIKRYFEGEELVEVNNNMALKNVYTPSKIVLGKSGAFTAVKIGEEFVAPDTALPLGATRKVGVVGVEEVELVENAVLAISEAKERDDVATSPVVGFLVCLDESSGKMLSVQPKLPKLSFLIQGTLRYF
ncbi:CLP1 [Enterospora canceri]|uniref:Polynucleotide 5'-hydroxyl-kinase GRC3 n=1 Tax=Enterospora canceri TaxID=1081671 RepID=A0A1Y1S5R3_9MICR|nr:CLP1 [Enterospora canceri]